MLYDPAKEDVSLPALSVDLGNSPGRELQVMGQTDITLASGVLVGKASQGVRALPRPSPPELKLASGGRGLTALIYLGEQGR